MTFSLRRIIVTASILFLAMFTIAAQAVVPLPLEEYEYSVEQIAHMRNQADQGDANAQYQMGNLYYYGQGIPSDYLQAAEWYKKAKVSPQGTSTDFELSRIDAFTEKHAELYAAAQSGEVKALYEFANHQPHNATGLEGDAPRPHWLLLAAKKGHVYSQRDIGDLYFRAYYKRRIEAGHTEKFARYWLRTPLNFDGESLDTDLPNAIFWLEKAAGNGEKSGLRLINASAEDMNRSWALMIDRGSSAPNGPCDVLFSGKLRRYPVDRSSDIWLIKYDRAPDYERARACYETADDPDAWYRLGMMYHGGKGVTRDDVKAVSYLTRAVQSKNYRAAAAYELALVYADSPTVPKNESESYIRLNETIAWLDLTSSSPCGHSDPEIYDRLEELNYNVRRNAQLAYENLASRISKKNLAKANTRLLAEGILKTESIPPPIPNIMPCF